ncbi:MAG: hypothetical protein RIQ89_824 [Bacteroidota bacterium]
MAVFKYINNNGSVVDSDQPIFTAQNRAFRYGDALFETIRLMDGEILYLDKHLLRLKSGMKVLGMSFHSDFTFNNMHLMMQHLDQVNSMKGNGRFRLEVYRQDGGYYTPSNNEVAYVLEAESVNNKRYLLNDIGLRIEIYMEHQKPTTPLSNIKSSNALCYVLAGMFRRNSGFDDCLVLNTNNNICEAISSNIFLVKEKVLFTPALSEGCVAGVMRQVVIDQVKSSGKQVEETKITISDLLSADEIFITDVINGIRWVGAFRNKRYFNLYSRDLLSKINETRMVK